MTTAGLEEQTHSGGSQVASFGGDATRGLGGFFRCSTWPGSWAPHVGRLLR